MPKGKGYGTFEETFGSQDKQLYDSTSSENIARHEREGEERRGVSPQDQVGERR